MVEREGCPIKGDRCRVSVPMMPVRLGADTVSERSGGIWFGLHPAWLEFGERLTPLLAYDFAKRSMSKA